ncbi:MAG: DNA-protecting protein DprA [Rhizobiales bacterium]|nr:DNA-protecting protein DprA [Hyphomicrobiales bacterium]
MRRKTLNHGYQNHDGCEFSNSQKLAWLRLIRSENIGPISFHTLIKKYGGAAEALEALPELSAKGGMRRQIRICPEDRAEAEMDAALSEGLTLVALGEQDYPFLLQHIDAAPPLLFVRGKTDLLPSPAIAIVGSRNCSVAGARLAGEFAAGLAEAGLTIISGLARGIDAAAHRATLSQGTIAVLAGGANTVYPDKHVELATAIAETGALISEMPVGYLPRARDFPRRNRIISGIAIGTLVVEAATRSGSLITARLASEQGRDVFAIPGSPLDPRTEGANRLLKQGAQLVTSVDDILDTIAPQLEDPDMVLSRTSGQASLEAKEHEWHETSEPSDDDRERIVQSLSLTPVTNDDIIRQCDVPAGTVISVLMELDIAGRIERHPGQRVSLI